MNLQLEVREFPFLEAPKTETLNEALESLKYQNIVSSKDASQLTPIGELLADLPVDVLVGKVKDTKRKSLKRSIACNSRCFCMEPPLKRPMSF